MTSKPTEHQQTILVMIRKAGSLSISEIAEELGVTHEALRQTLRRMNRAGLVQQFSLSTGKKGRPAFAYQVTPLGQESFNLPLSELLTTLLELVDTETATEAIAQSYVALWHDRLEGLNHYQKVEALVDIYQLDDPFMAVEGPNLHRLFPAYANQLRDTTVTCEAARRAIGYLLVTEVSHHHDEGGACSFLPALRLTVAQ